MNVDPTDPNRPTADPVLQPNSEAHILLNIQGFQARIKFGHNLSNVFNRRCALLCSKSSTPSKPMARRQSTRLSTKLDLLSAPMDRQSTIEMCIEHEAIDHGIKSHAFVVSVYIGTTDNVYGHLLFESGQHLFATQFGNAICRTRRGRIFR